VSAVLVIAGSDSSGGAGLVRDLRTLTDLDTPALCALTAVTAQTDHAVVHSEVLPEHVVRAQIEAAFATRAVAAVKIGMLATAATVRVVAEALGPRAGVPVVLDPVLAASSGGTLLDEDGRAALRGLLPRVALLTPNLPEAAALLGEAPAVTPSAVLAQARGLLALGVAAVLLKGGHGSGDEATDWLVTAGGEPRALSAPRLAHGIRGSGCALASAIAAYLAHGLALADACQHAKEYVTALILRSS